jgi:hypothetical protein
MRSLVVDAVLALGVALVVIGILTANVFTAAGALEPTATNVVGVVVVGIVVFVGLRIARTVLRRRA